MPKISKPQFNIRTFALASLATVAILGYLSYSSSPAEENAITSIKQRIYPTLYSDTHITSNAKISDPRFRKLSTLTPSDLLANSISSVVRTDTNLFENVPERGTWLWTPVLDQTPEYQSKIVSQAKQNGIKNIYVSIDSYLDVYVMADGPEKDAKKKAFDTALSNLIRLAHKNDITVDAEAGWRNWAEIGNSYKAFAVLSYAINYNKTHTDKLRGFQYDIEPYLLDAYQQNKAKVLGNYVNLVDETVARLNNSDLIFSVVIPEFYDGKDNETPKFLYAGQKTYTLGHLLKILDRREGSKIIVMSYRNFSKGDDGTIDISKDEISLADSYKTKIVVAQETGDVDPPYITYYNTKRSYYDKQSRILQTAFAQNKSFGGIAVHYINAFVDLK